MMDIIFNFFFHSPRVKFIFPGAPANFFVVYLACFIDTSHTITTLIFNNNFHKDFEANNFVIIGWRKILDALSTLNLK